MDENKRQSLLTSKTSKRNNGKLQGAAKEKSWKTSKVYKKQVGFKKSNYTAALDDSAY
jgi:hypothetical protein